MSRVSILRLFFGGFEEDSIPADMKSLQSFLELAPGSFFDHEDTRRAGDTLNDRWQRAKKFIKSQASTTPQVKVQILTRSIGFHLGAKAASLMAQRGHDVEALFAIVPDPKYRTCEADKQDKINRPELPSAYEECCDLWKVPRHSDEHSPGKMLQKRLRRLAHQGVAIHLIASKCDTVAEWRDNTEILYERKQKHVYWWFAGEHTPHKSSKYQVRVMLDPSCPIKEIHSRLDCTITRRGAKRSGRANEPSSD